jgi:hypothetical protein
MAISARNAIQVKGRETMTLDTEQRIETPAKSAAKPPPRAVESGYHLFQTMDELRTRHGVAWRTKERTLHVAAALGGGALLFAALYAVILFLE